MGIGTNIGSSITNTPTRSDVIQAVDVPDPYQDSNQR